MKFLVTAILVVLLISGSVGEQKWAQHGLIFGDPSNILFGASVSLSLDGNSLAVGGFGHARTFTFDGTSYTQRGLLIEGEEVGDEFGLTLSLSADGSVLAVGAAENSNSKPLAGMVRLFEYNNDSISQRGSDIFGEDEGDQAGHSVALSGNGSILAIGAPRNDGNGNRAGHVRVFQYNGSCYVQRGQDIDGENPTDSSGDSIALSEDGSVLVIGATKNSDSANYAGQVRIFKYNGTQYNRMEMNIDGDVAFRNLGVSIALSCDGSIIAIAAASTSLVGQVKVFEFNGSSYEQRGQELQAEDLTDFFGKPVAMNCDGTVLAVGESANAEFGRDAGLVRVYVYNKTDYEQFGETIYGESLGEGAGTSVSLSADGRILAIGSPGKFSSTGQVQILKANDDFFNDPTDPSLSPTWAPTSLTTYTVSPSTQARNDSQIIGVIIGSLGLFIVALFASAFVIAGSRKVHIPVVDSNMYVASFADSNVSFGTEGE